MSNDSKLYVISFPKCGRTWLNVILGKYHCDLLDIDPKDMIHSDLGPTMPIFTHDGSSYRYDKSLPNGGKSARTYKNLTKNKSGFKGDRAIFLVRDPRDIMVSYYMHTLYRRNYLDPTLNQFDGLTNKVTVSDFIRDARFGVKKLFAFWSVWLNNLDILDDHLIVKYEDLRREPQKTVLKILKFSGAEINKKKIRQAIRFSSFDNMKKMEKENFFNWEGLHTNGDQGQEAMKVRKGKIGDFKNHFTKEDLYFIRRTARRFGIPWYREELNEINRVNGRSKKS